MPYRCRCGNADTFYEIFDIAVDVVDGADNYLQMKDRNVDCYICCECERRISYEDSMRAVAVRTSLAD
jgi:uncharacterized protein YlaI